MADAEEIRVLLVEDDEDSRFAVSDYLKLEGCRVDCAAEGGEALALLASRDYDAVLLDLIMPGVDGYEFLRRYGGPVPVVVASAMVDFVDLPREPFARVLKPLDIPGEVLPTLGKAAETRRRSP